MKKIFLTLLIFSLGLSAFAKPNYSYTVHQTPTPIQTNNSVYNYDYMPQTNQTSNTQATSNSNYGIYVDEEITTPLTQIGIPQELLTIQKDEDGLDISWNQWHADVFNKITEKVFAYNIWGEVVGAFVGEDIINKHPTNCIFYISATVNSERDISNIIVVIVKGNGMEFKNSKALITKNTSITMYSNNNGKYYSLSYTGEPININAKGLDTEGAIRKILTNSKLVELSNDNDFDMKYSKKTCENLKTLSGKSFLKFPTNSKRKTQNIYYAISDLDNINKIQEATADMFDDVEK